MKNILLYIIVGAFAITSCKKDHAKKSDPDANDTKPVKVTFNVGFSKTVTSFETGHLKTNALSTNAIDTSLSNHVERLSYMLYNRTTGRIVIYLTQTTTDTTFGGFNANLSPGSYILAVGAGPTRFVLTDKADVIGHDLMGYPQYAFVFDGFGSDTFFTRDTITVGDVPVIKNIALNRIVSGLVVSLTDDIIATHGVNISVTVRGSANIFHIKDNSASYQTAGSGFPTQPSSSVSIAPGSFTGHAQSKLVFFLYDPASPVTVDIKATDKLTNASVEKIVYNVTAEPNKITMLTGSLFSTTTSGYDYQIKTDTAWSTTTTVRHF